MLYLLYSNLKGALKLSDLTYTDSMMNEIRELLLNARQRVAVQVNTELLSTYWNVGKIIVGHEQENKDRADYGKQTLKELSKKLTDEFGKGIFTFKLAEYESILSCISNLPDSVWQIELVALL